jgi:polynucleotide 5'-kinase involved in rRNA processing
MHRLAISRGKTLQLAEFKGCDRPMAGSLYQRSMESRLTDALADSPVVLIHGPRQCGKTALARIVGDRAGYTYFSFDTQGIREAAQADPIGIDNQDVSF